MLEIRRLTKSFGALTVLEEVSLTVEPGLIHSLIGPNGAGKSTLVNLIAGSYRPTSGEIRLDGQRLDGRKKWHVAAAGVARTYQNIRLFDALSAAENLRVGLYLREKKNILREIFGASAVRRRQRAVCIDMLRRFGLEAYADIAVETMPYGRQKLLEILRALMCDPRVLLLDEPAAGLNHAETAELRERIRALRRPDRVLVLIEHDMDLVMAVSDRISVLHRGRIIRTGTPAEVAADEQVKEAYLGNGSEIDAIRALAQGRRARLRLRQDHDLAWH